MKTHTEQALLTTLSTLQPITVLKTLLIEKQKHKVLPPTVIDCEISPKSNIEQVRRNKIFQEQPQYLHFEQRNQININPTSKGSDDTKQENNLRSLYRNLINNTN